MTQPVDHPVRSGFGTLVRRVVIIGAHLIVSSIVFRLFVGHDSMDLRGAPADFKAMVEGTAHRPYVYRTLLPSAIRFIVAATPPAIQEQIVHAVQGKSLFPGYLHGDRAMEYAVGLPLVFLCFLGTSVLLRLLGRHFYKGNTLYENIAAYGGMLVLPLFFVNYSHLVYDPPTVMLFSLAVLLIAQRRTALLFALLPFLAAQKETSVLAIGLFAVAEYKRRTRLELAGMLSIMAIVWGSTKALITMAFQNNPGSMAELHLFDHNLILYRFPVPALYALCATAMFALIVSYRWKENDLFLRQGLIVVALPLFLLMIPFGQVDELRNLYEAFPILVLLMVPTVGEAMSAMSAVDGRSDLN